MAIDVTDAVCKLVDPEILPAPLDELLVVLSGLSRETTDPVPAQFLGDVLVDVIEPHHPEIVEVLGHIATHAQLFNAFDELLEMKYASLGPSGYSLSPSGLARARQHPDHQLYQDVLSWEASDE